MESSSRHFVNHLKDYNGISLLLQSSNSDADGITRPNKATDIASVKQEVRQSLLTSISKLQNILEENFSKFSDDHDCSIYTGTTGIAVLYIHCANCLGEENKLHYLNKAEILIKKGLKSLKRRKVSFLCGDPGPLAVGAWLYHLLGKDKDRDKCLERLYDRRQDTVDADVADEVLFGRTGYLSALLFVSHHLGPEFVQESDIKQMYDRIIESGRKLAHRQKSSCPLMYEWHGKKYLGAAHGLAGIFYNLLQLKGSHYESSQQELVRPSIDYLMTLRFPSGNYPSSVGSATGDKLVHWCHGAPGWILMFVQAYKTFGDDKYLEAAISCAEVIWSRGLLKKGYGICHGVAGNAYGFLLIFNLTGDEKYLHRAMKFAEWCFDYGSHGCPQPDRPLSLFEGLAGTIYFLVDMLDPHKAKFPAFQFD